MRSEEEIKEKFKQAENNVESCLSACSRGCPDELEQLLTWYGWREAMKWVLGE